MEWVRPVLVDRRNELQRQGDDERAGRTDHRLDDSGSGTDGQAGLERAEQHRRGSAITGYEYGHKKGSEARTWVAIDNSASLTSYTASGFDAETNYTFRLRASNSAGDGLWSNERNVRTGGLPTVESLEITSDPGTDETYGPRSVAKILATVTFSEAVAVTGQPQLPLNIGGGTLTVASYKSGSETTELVFEIATVNYGQEDTDGVSINANALTNAGGTITAVSDGVAAVLDHDELPDQSGHKVDGVRPTYVEGEVAADGTKLVLTFSEDIGETDHAKMTVKVNGTAVTTTGTSVSGKKVDVTLQDTITDSGATVTVELAIAAVGDTFRNPNLPLGAQTVVNNYAPTEWELTLSGGKGEATVPGSEEKERVIEEGGAPVTVTLTITNGATFATAQTVTLVWAGNALQSDVNFIVGANNTTTITIPANEAMGTLVISAPDPGGTPSYRSSGSAELIAQVGNVNLASARLAFVDDDDPPEMTLTAETAAVAEGDVIRLKARWSLGYADADAGLSVGWTGPDGVVDDAALLTFGGNAIFNVPSGVTETTLTVPTTEDTTAEGVATLVFSLVAVPQDPPRKPDYTLGDPSVADSVRQHVLIRDVAAAGGPDDARVGSSYIEEGQTACRRA